jgi:hypothetical protein
MDGELIGLKKIDGFKFDAALHQVRHERHFGRAGPT